MKKFNALAMLFCCTLMGFAAEIVSVSPNSAKQGEVIRVTISGTNTSFSQASSTVYFGQGSTTLNVTNKFVLSSTQLRVDVNVPMNAQPIQYDLTIVTEGTPSPVSLPNAFTVTRNMDQIQVSSGAINTPINKEFLLPVFISTGFTNYKFISYQYDFLYDATRLQYIGFTTANSMAANGMLNINASQAGVLKVGYIGSQELSGDGILNYLKFKSIHLGATQPGLTNFLVNTDTVKSAFANRIYTFNLYGDADGNNSIQAYDAALVLQYALQMDPMPSVDPRPWEEWRIKSVDVDCNGQIQAFDAALILQRSLNIISSFPCEANSSGSAAPPLDNADVEIIRDGQNLLIKSYGSLLALELIMEGHTGAIGSPSQIDPSFIYAANNTPKKFHMGFATHEPLTDGSTIMTLPIYDLGIEELSFDVVINTRDAQKIAKISTANIVHIETGVVVYPIPANDRLTIVVDLQKHTVSRISISNMLGQIVYDGEVSNSRNYLDISQLPANSIYNLQIFDHQNHLIYQRKIQK